ncbi:MAG: DUF2341 domain-containing protein, partial [Chitinivibrionales bacterium]|nr:DUF2341 domain-containing protein [Chitinivibrionales bacterium]
MSTAQTAPEHQQEHGGCAGMKSATRITPFAFVLGLWFAAGTHAAEDYSLWGDSAKVMLNTTATGANVAADVYNFPVLVRLTSSNFDFSSAEFAGNDIRFVKDDRATLMKFDIELFDKGEQQAAIWVRVDTVYGNRDDQYFMLYWNNPSASDSSSPAGVFPSSEGYEAVWHLGESVTDGSAGFVDVTGLGHDAVAKNFGAGPPAQTHVADGIGRCVDLGIDSAMIEPNNGSSLVPSSELMVSTWFKATVPLPNDDLILIGTRKSTGSEFPYRLGFTHGRACFDLVDTGDVGRRAQVASGVAEGSWHHVVGWWGNDSMTIYLDGQRRRDPQYTGGTPLASANWGGRIGAENSGGRMHFDGRLDEMRVYSSARSADWIRLEYMNQRPDDSLVTIEPAACVSPAISRHPENKETPAGGQVALSVGATGTTRSYRWEVDTGAGFTTIAGATDSTYTFTAALSDSGSRYHCTVLNGCGQATSNACTLSVTTVCDTPQVQSHPSDTSVIEKSSVSFTVSATGDGLTYQWLRNGAVVSGATDSSHTFTAQRWDNGATFRCAISGVCGVDTSNPAVLTVADTTRPNSLTALTVNAVSSTELNVQWTTPESDSTDADSVFVLYSSSGYPSLQPLVGQVVAALPVVPIGTTQATRDTSVDGLTPGNTVYVGVWISD